MSSIIMKFPVLIIGNFLSKHSGAFGVCEDLANHLQKDGWPIIRTSNKRNKIIRHLDQLWVVLSRFGQYKLATIDIFSGISFYWNVFLIIIIRLFKLPVVLVLHGGDLPNFANKRPNLIRFGLGFATTIVAPSKYLAEKMSPYCKEIKIIPNAIEITNYQYDKKINFNQNLLWLRAFDEIYNPLLVIKVAGLLQAEFPRLKIHMRGGDSGDGTLQEVLNLVEEFNIIDNFDIDGKISKNQVPSYLKSGDIFINTTNIDNTPVTVIEAMACGLCVVSTNVGGIPYLLEDEVDALLVPPNDPKAMAIAVRRIMTEPDLASKLSENARKKAEKFDWSNILPLWEELFISKKQNQG